MNSELYLNKLFYTFLRRERNCVFIDRNDGCSSSMKRGKTISFVIFYGRRKVVKYDMNFAGWLAGTDFCKLDQVKI